MKTIFTFAAAFASVVVIGVCAAYLYVRPDLPTTYEINNIRLQIPLRIYSSEGTLLGVFGDKKSIPLTLKDIPNQMIDAFISSEDDDFFQHRGVDLWGLLRAAWNLLSSGEKRQGGSTITMQLARNFFLSSERTYERKIKEIFLALLMEKQFDKEKILSLYLNKIFFGHRAYGVGAAAEVYYGSKPSELTLAQTAMIAGLPKAPSRYNPISSPELAIKRRDYVLRRMFELGKIGEDDYQSALDTPVTAKKHVAPSIELDAPYVAEHIRREMLSRYGAEAYTGGYEVKTTINGDLQLQAQRSLRKSLSQYDRRHGYRGPEKSFASLRVEGDEPSAILKRINKTGDLLPAIVIKAGESTAEVVLSDGQVIALGKEAWIWARRQVKNGVGRSPKRADEVMRVGDLVRVAKAERGWALRQEPEAAGALISLRTDDGAVVAMVGGFDFSQSNFNRATQARRQPGSGFKPVIYAAALNKGYTPATLVKDLPVVYDGRDLEPDWRPGNYTREFSGKIRLREALSQSRNLVSVRLGRELGLSEIFSSAKKFGFTTESYPRDMTVALGSGEVLLAEMASAYAVFANGGSRVFFHLIDSISAFGKTVYSSSTPAPYTPGCPHSSPASEDVQYLPRALGSGVAYQMTTMLRSVVSNGTGKRARELRRKDIAGKTGTTNDFRDAWFIGFNRELVTAVWTGFDDFRSLGKREPGSRVALPMWIDFMRYALADTPESSYCKPDDIVTLVINSNEGLLSYPDDPLAVSESFRKAHAPREFAKNEKAKSLQPSQLF